MNAVSCVDAISGISFGDYVLPLSFDHAALHTSPYCYRRDLRVRRSCPDKAARSAASARQGVQGLRGLPGDGGDTGGQFRDGFER